eukprot:s6054_g4.t1
MRRFFFLLCYAVGGRSLSRSFSGGTVDMSGILRWEADEVGALCDESILPKINCENNLWQQLLTLLCRHCSRNRCVSDPELEKVARMAIRLYVTMVERGQEDLGETFACKHGLFAALLFHSEHVPVEFRHPHVQVEVLRPPETIEFEVSMEEIQSKPAIMELYLRKFDVPNAAVDTARLQVTDAQGYPVIIRRGDDGGRILETDRRSSDGGTAFPLRVRYTPAKDQREFLNFKRHLSLQTKWDVPSRVVTMDLDVPVMSLSPFPFHTAKLKAMRLVSQEEYVHFVTEISRILAGAGIFHVVLDGDYTLRYWEMYLPLREEEYLTALGLSLRDASPLERFSIFVPLEQRHKVVELLGSPLPPLGRGDDPLTIGLKAGVRLLSGCFRL